MITLLPSGTIEFRLYRPDAKRVELVGSFTGWQQRAVAMERSPEGWWRVEARLGAGDHEFQYLVDGASWVADYAASGVRLNRFGTWVSQLHVPPGALGHAPLGVTHGETLAEVKPQAEEKAAA